MLLLRIKPEKFLSFVLFSLFFVFGSEGWSQPVYDNTVPWSQVLKPVFPNENRSTEEARKAFNSEISRLGALNPELIFWYSKVKSENRPETVTWFNYQLGEEIKRHNDWLKEVIKASEGDTLLSFADRLTVSRWASGLIFPEKERPEINAEKPVLTRSDTLFCRYVIFIYLKRQSGLKYDQTTDYSSLVLNEQQQILNKFSRIFDQIKRNEKPSDSEEADEFIFSNLHTIRTQKSTSVTAQKQIYQIPVSLRKRSMLLPDFTPLNPLKNRIQFSVGGGVQVHSADYTLTEIQDVSYAGKTYTLETTVSQPVWFLIAGLRIPVTENQSRFSHVTINLLLSAQPHQSELKSQSVGITSPDPDQTYSLAMAPSGEKNNSWSYQAQSMVTSDILAWEFLKVEAGLFAGYEGASIQVKGKIKKSIEVFDASGNYISSSPVGKDSDYSSKKSFGSAVFSPLLTVHTNLFGFTTLTTRVTYDRVMFSLEGWYPGNR